ncbi:hypothetical protein BTN45_25435 (plasmid) [Rhizobium sp. ZX09]|nr:hypothetical protein BTN45_25435 [Rhizobium sp. ZX09]
MIGRLTSEIHDAIGLDGASKYEEKMLYLAMATLEGEGLINIEEAPWISRIAEPVKTVARLRLLRPPPDCHCRKLASGLRFWARRTDTGHHPTG